MKKFALAGFVESINPSPTFLIDAEVKEMQGKGIKVYNLCLGEPDFFTPDRVKSEAIKAIVTNKTRYTQVRGMPELLAIISQKFKRENNLIYSPKEIIVSNGAKQILYLAVRTVCKIGNEIIVLSPYWVSYPTITRLAGGIPTVVESHDFRLSAKDINKAIGRRTKAIIINSPNNPTGLVYTREELEDLAEIVLRRKILVISDEIYEKFLYDGARHFSFASLVPELKNYAITVNGLSKTYAMTGFRIGYGGAPEYIIEKMVDLQSHVSSNACSVSQAASIEALSGDQEFSQGIVAEFDKRRRFVIKELENIGAELIRPQGAYYVFFRAYAGFDSIGFCREMIKRLQVALNPGESFGQPGWVRLSYTVNFDDLEEAMRRIGIMFGRG